MGSKVISEALKLSSRINILKENPFIQEAFAKLSTSIPTLHQICAINDTYLHHETMNHDALSALKQSNAISSNAIINNVSFMDDSYPKVEEIKKEVDSQGCTYRYFHIDLSSQTVNCAEGLAADAADHYVSVFFHKDNQGKYIAHYFDSLGNYKNTYKDLQNHFNVFDITLSNSNPNILISDGNCGVYSMLFAYLSYVKYFPQSKELLPVEQILSKISGINIDDIKQQLSRKPAATVLRRMFEKNNNIASTLKLYMIDDLIKKALSKPEGLSVLTQEVDAALAELNKFIKCNSESENIAIASMLALLSGMALHFQPVIPISIILFISSAPSCYSSLANKNKQNELSSIGKDVQNSCKEAYNSESQNQEPLINMTMKK